jgi:WD40 repeat protein
MKTFAQLQLLARHTSTVAGVAFSQDDRWVATAGAAKAGVWSTFPSDLPGGFLFFARGNVPPLTAVAWSPQGWMLATASRDGSVRVLSCALCGRLPQLRSAARAVARRFPSG